MQTPDGKRKFPIELRNCVSVFNCNGRTYAQAFMLFRLFNKRFTFWTDMVEVP